MCIPLNPLSLGPRKLAAGQPGGGGRPGLGASHPRPARPPRTLRESGKMEQEGRLRFRTHLHPPLRCWGGCRGGASQSGGQGQVPRSSATPLLKGAATIAFLPASLTCRTSEAGVQQPDRPPSELRFPAPAHSRLSSQRGSTP